MLFTRVDVQRADELLVSQRPLPLQQLVPTGDPTLVPPRSSGAGCQEGAGLRNRHRHLHHVHAHLITRKDKKRNITRGTACGAAGDEGEKRGGAGRGTGTLLVPLLLLAMLRFLLCFFVAFSVDKNPCFCRADGGFYWHKSQLKPSQRPAIYSHPW